MNNTDRLNLNAVITNAEIYAANVIKSRLEASGIKEGTTNYKIIIARTADLLAHHKEEVRDMYKKNKMLIQQWIVRETHLEDLKALKKMKTFGFTGDIVEDLKKMESGKKHDDFLDAALYATGRSKTDR